MGIGPIARWKKASLPEIAVRLRWAFVISLVSAIALPFALGQWKALSSLGLMLAFWIVTTVLLNLWERIRPAGGQVTLLQKIKAQSRSYYGMQLAHVGVAVFIVGVTLVMGYQTEQDVRMGIGDTIQAGGYEFKFNGVSDVAGPNYVAGRAEIIVSKNGSEVNRMFPEKRNYTATGNVMTESAIDMGLTRHLYVSLGEPLNNGAQRADSLQNHSWLIWGGAVLMAMAAD
jgi:cytochrome c-type biogenesis protein CcmF